MPVTSPLPNAMSSCGESAPRPRFASSACSCRSIASTARPSAAPPRSWTRELDDLEIDFAASVPDIELPIVADSDKVRVLPVRKLNPNLPRERVVREPSCACCPGCGGDLRAMGEDSEEMLDLVAQAWQVMETVRPKYSCRTCDKIIQAPAPAKAIARGKLSYAALAHIMMAKWGYHLPFYRQAQMMAAKGVDIERSTLARSAGYAAALLDPIYNRIREIGRTRSKIHTDDTRLPILAPSTGKTHKGALGLRRRRPQLGLEGAADRLVSRHHGPRRRERDERARRICRHAPGRWIQRLQSDLQGRRHREAACLAHLRRKIFDVHDSQPTELSTTAMAGIQAIYRIEEEIRGAPARRALGRTTKADPTTGPRAATTAHAPRQGFVAPCRYREGLRLWQQPMARVQSLPLRWTARARQPDRGAGHSWLYSRPTQLAFFGQLRRGGAVSGRAQHH